MEVERMIELFDKAHIIKLIIDEGMSLRAVSKMTGRDRKTVTKYYKEHMLLVESLNNEVCSDEIRTIQNKIVEAPKYPKRQTPARKWTKEMDEFMDYQLELENDRTIKFGINHKQRLTNVLMHELMLDEGFDIGLTTVRGKMRLKRDELKEVFIRQTYKPGDRFEFDYGEFPLMINGVKQKLHLAVISSPYSNFRTAYLYKSQDQRTFLDAHNRLFAEIGGVPKEMVYDNMRNVVSKFIGKNDKEINKKLLQTSLYYGFNINVTNCFSGNEKGHVEGSVRYIRSKVFTSHYEFDSFEEAEERLKNKLKELNKKSRIEDEKESLIPLKPLLDLADVRNQKVNKYSTIQVEKNFYSVPELLIGKNVIVKNYLTLIEVYYNHKLVAQHNKKDGHSEYIIDIMHFLQTFKRKPGALKNSEALLNNVDLKTIFDKYYITQPKLFIELLAEHKDKNSNELNRILIDNHHIEARTKIIESNINQAIYDQLSIYTDLMNRSAN